jgi:hypothetical protein
MEKSKAISPELSGLFSKIERQAEEYENAFNELNKFHRDAERLWRENEELMQKHNELFEKSIELYERLEKIESYINLRLKNVIEEIIKHLEVTVIDRNIAKTNEAIKDFEVKAEKAIGLIEGSDGIVKIVESVRLLAKELDQKVLDVDERIAMIDHKIDSKVEDFNQKGEDLSKASESFHNLKTQIEELMNETSNKIATSIADIQQKSEAMFTAMFNNVSFNLEQRIKDTIVEVKDSQTIINQKIRKTDTKIDSFVGIAQQLESHLKELKDTSGSSNKQMIEALKLRIEEINDNLTNKIAAISSGNKT